MAVRIVREAWVVRDSGAVALNVKSGIVLTIDEANSSRIPVYGYSLGNREGRVELGVYESRKDAVAAIDSIVKGTG